MSRQYSAHEAPPAAPQPLSHAFSRLSLAALVLALVSLSASVSFAESLKGEILVVLGKETPGPVAAELKAIPELSKPPFNAYKSMSVASKSKFGVKVGSEKSLKLPNGRTLKVRVEKVMPDKRFLVRVSITKPGETAFLPLLQVAAQPGKRFFVAGQRHQDGTLFVGVRLGG